MTVAERVDPAVFQDYANYHRHLKIRDRVSKVPVPLSLNRVQRRLLNRFIRAQHEGRPGRFLVDKARQMGISTAVQSFISAEAFTRCHVSALTLSKDDESTHEVHSMMELMFDELPAAIRPVRVTNERGRRLYMEHGSKMRAQTAGSREAGRSMALTHVHGTEVAFWPDAAQTLLALRQTVQEEPGTLIVLESTANGRQGAFYHEWLRAVEGESDYEAIFFGWHEFPAYTASAIRISDLDESAVTDEEHTLRERFDLTLGQLAWRRWAIANKCGGDLSTFHQEYPATAEESFIHSGRPFFQPLLTQRLHTLAEKRSPVFQGDLGAPGAYPAPGEAARPNASSTGRLRIFQKPQKGHRYVLSVDPAGVLTGKEFEAFPDKRQARDYCAMFCVDRHTRKTVAYWRSRIDLGLVGAEAAKIGRLYSAEAPALIAVEMTGGYGAPALDWLRAHGYNNLYTRVQLDHERKPISEELGWMTSSQNRTRILEGLRDVLREDPAAIAIPELAVEMDSFIEGDSAKAAAAPGKHDDLVMAAAIAFEVVREYPQTRIQKDAA